MAWFVKFLKSSIGHKLVMSLTGLFLIIFLLIHLGGNLQLLRNDDGAAFTAFVEFMETNPLVKISAYILYAGFLIHIIQGILLWLENRKARGGQNYAVKSSYKTTWAARNMPLLGGILLVFLIIHMGDFWRELKFGDLADEDLYNDVIHAFKNPIILVIYEIGMVALFFHLSHGFQSAFQTLGLNHSKYNLCIKRLGMIYAVVVALAFFLIPLLVFFLK